MSTLINLVIAIAASLLSLTGVLRDTQDISDARIMQCQHIDSMNMHFIIENEQLSQ